MNRVISEAFDMTRDVRAQVSEIRFIHGVTLEPPQFEYFTPCTGESLAAGGSLPPSDGAVLFNFLSGRLRF
jgi:hypothetical protein